MLLREEESGSSLLGSLQIIIKDILGTYLYHYLTVANYNQ